MDATGYVDTHVNIPNVFEALKLELPENDGWNVIQAAFPSANSNYSLSAILSVASLPSDAASNKKTLELANSIPQVFGAYGIHPLYAYEWTPEVEQEKLDAMSSPKTVAWGEIGLDYHDFGPKYNYAKPDLQKSTFVTQINHALSAKKPIIIHTREAEEDTFDLMKQHIPQDWKVHVHCFTDTAPFAKKLIQEWPNLWLGFTGVVTFKNAAKIQGVVKEVPVDRLLFETDGPFMAPEPFRGKTCHPGMVPPTAAKIAQLKGVPQEELYRIVRENTKNMYGI